VPPDDDPALPPDDDPALPPDDDPALPPDDNDPAAPPADNDPAAPPVPLLPAEPPVAVVDPSRAVVDHEPELEEHAIAAPKSSEMTVHCPTRGIPKAPLMVRLQATREPRRGPMFSSTYH
jgi:hypothetical protein